MSGRNSFLAGRRGPGCPEPWCPAPGGASGRAGRGPAEVLWREVPSAAELEQADLQGPFRPTVRVSMKDLAPRPQTQRGVPPLPRRLRERREALQRGKPAPSPWSASLALPDARRPTPTVPQRAAHLYPWRPAELRPPPGLKMAAGTPAVGRRKPGGRCSGASWEGGGVSWQRAAPRGRACGSGCRRCRRRLAVAATSAAGHGPGTYLALL